MDGRAIGLQVDAGLAVAGLRLAVGVGADVVLSDTGALPASGGINKADLLTATVPGVLTAGVLEASTASTGDEAVSDASVSGIALRGGGIGIAANVLASHAMAICETAGAAGAGNIAGLAIDGKGSS